MTHLPRLVVLVGLCWAGMTEGESSSADAPASPGATPPAWATPIQEVVDAQSLDGLIASREWENSGGPAGTVSRTTEGLAPAGPALRFEVKVDHRDPGPYPIGWPSCQTRLDPPVDWSAYDGLRFRVYAQCDDPKLPLPIRIIIHGADLQQLLPALKDGSDRTVIIPFPRGPSVTLNKISLVHFFISEGDYPHGAHAVFSFGDFGLVKLRTTRAALPSAEAGVELFVGPAAEAVLLPADTRSLAGMAVVHTGAGLRVGPSARLVYTATELFTDRKLRHEQALPRPLGSGERTEIPFELPLAGLHAPPGYYWLTCDLVQGRKSLVAGRVGFEDFYLEDPDESMVHAMLSLRLGMARYIVDPLGGYGAGSAAFLHTYDPRDSSHYPEFIRAYGGDTGKHSEGLEAGVAGTVFAAHAFRGTGEPARARFAEDLIKSNCDYMVHYMQDSDGGTRTWVNAYYDRHLGEWENAPSDQGGRDTNQIGEWLRPIARALLYFRQVPSGKAYSRRLYAAAQRTGDYLASVTTDTVGSRHHVIRHFGLAGYGAQTRRNLYTQEGRQCDVYVGRAMAGLSYFAYLRQLREGTVPRAYLEALADTTAWALEKMQSDTGWFDWQCGYEVEGGCHAFLGNLYLAEGAQGYYLLCAARGDAEEARRAAECTRRALHFITDHERQFRPVGPGVLEFWGGPYLYWQLTEYLGSIGPDPAFSAHLAAMHRGWAEQRQWRDFTQRAGPGLVHRADGLTHLTMSIVGYPALRLLEETGKPFRYLLAAVDRGHE